MERPGESQQQMWALHLGLVLMHVSLACVQVNAVYVQTGNCHCNQRVEQRYFGVKLLMDYLSVQLNTEVSPEGTVCLLEPFKILLKRSISYIRNKKVSDCNLCCDECCRFDI